jgi:NAD(P)H-dependent FMN reductase
MKEAPLHVLCVIGTSGRNSATHAVVGHIARRLGVLGAGVDLFDPVKEPLALFNPESSHVSQPFVDLKARVERADAYVFGTPDYHGSVSSTLKNFLDHFWQEFTGKLFGEVVCSNEKGLTVIDQLRTVARQCYAWTLPYGLSFAVLDLKENEIASEAFDNRIDMFVHDFHAYGLLLRQQRRVDLGENLPGFNARGRTPNRSEKSQSTPMQPQSSVAQVRM